MKFIEKRVRRYENAHVILWLIKDFSWMMNWKLLGILMIIPTIAMSIFIAYFSRSHVSGFWHNIAIVFWISANSIWMLGEFWFDDQLRPVSAVLFGLGFLTLLNYYFFIAKRKNVNS